MRPSLTLIGMPSRFHVSHSAFEARSDGVLFLKKADKGHARLSIDIGAH